MNDSRTTELSIKGNPNDNNSTGEENEETAESLISEISSFIIEWIGAFTMHGFGNIINAEFRVAKVVWTILTIGLIGYCIFLTYSTVASFLQFNTNVSVKKVRTESSEFPAVTFCNLNAFDVATHNFSGWYINKILQETGVRGHLVPTDEEDAIFLIEEAHEVLKAAIVSDSNLTIEHLKDIGYRLDTMLVSCYFDGVKCNSSDFTWSYSYDYGNCYTFNSAYDDERNSKKAITTSKSGPASGLILELFSGAPGKQDFYLLSRGFYLQINNRTDKPFVKYSGIQLPTGQASNVEVRKEVVKSVPAPYSQCRKDLTPRQTDSRYYKYTSSITTYYQHLCVDIYFQLTLVVPRCGCYEANSPIFDRALEICRTVEEIECAKGQIQYMNTPVSIEDCPKECDYTTFLTAVNSAGYPTDYYAEMLLAQPKIRARFTHEFEFVPHDREGTTERPTTQAGTTARPRESEVTIQKLEQSMAKIKIHLDGLEYTLVEETPAFTVDSFIGSLGGIFGLFVGASIFSFIEIFAMLVNVGYITINHMLGSTKKNKVEHKEQNELKYNSNLIRTNDFILTEA